MKKTIILFSALFTLMACSSDDNSTKITDNEKPIEKPEEPGKKYKTENVIILSIDGPRMSETWLEEKQQYIPNRVELLKQGVFINNFQNNGMTNTNAGHTALITGVYDTISNNGKELPTYPSVLQQWLKHSKADSLKAWVIVSKDKLAVLNNSKQQEWNNKYMPATDAGIAGNGTGYREDMVTMNNLRDVMVKHSPNLIVVNLKDVDSYGHGNNWKKYIESIQITDQSIKDIWDYIQALPQYKDKTTLIVSNDHGRHIDGHKTGFKDHGDDCTGCRHIEFFAMGPDFKQNATISTGNYEQIDVASTVAELLEFPLEYAKGKVIKDAFK
ncbi:MULTISPECIES: alkaline phosphatase family protein [Myroides]|uniref:Sulfatase-like hydrolase/transferase n=1 Tax=Myroides albus TaxID=2562892 RepID=A0A6I3LMA6_9FLAO|nr:MULTISPECIES: alkaline phosphatase family protein [Myroides]MTG97302.1 sulfatase-like hydrolase/transferase [Myroides albus]MVX37163.1 sulfatase-like hydrolase/transferase [Myroides sp. LoEW2-1]UVD80611.1 alkaline phosphatase family protein [Myroides albus]